MTKEEKQAIETVKQYKKCFIFETVHEETGERLNDYSNAIDIVLNLIDKQQKEIENYKNLIEEVSQIAKELKLEEDGTIDEILIKIKQQQKEIEVLREENFDTIYMKAVADFKDKIREKIKEIENIETDKITREEYNRIEFAIEILLELLEE